jgi:hypothetical protein
MRTANRRRATWAIAVSALAHLGVLAAALLAHSTLPPQAQDIAGPPEAIIPVLILPRSRLADGAPRLGELQLHRRPQRLDERPSPAQPSAMAPLSAPPAPAKPAEPGQLSALAADGQPVAPGESAPDLRAALRHGALGCANLAAVGMTRAEREACEEQLGHGAAQAPVLAVSLEPRIRAYYDAVALAKTRDPPLMPPRNDRAPIPGDPPPHRPGADHVPLIGCAIPFGPGEKPKLPAHWLKLGPCFIAPPKGPFTVEADITPP